MEFTLKKQQRFPEHVSPKLYFFNIYARIIEDFQI